MLDTKYWCLFVTGSAGMTYYYPPILNVATSYIDVPSNSTLHLQCEGKYPLTWKLPEQWSQNTTERTSITYSFHELQGQDKFFSELEVNHTIFLDTGQYLCYYNDSTDLGFQANATSVYVFVNDPETLFVPFRDYGHFLLQMVLQGTPTTLSCLPTNSKTNVTLWKVTSNGNQQVMIDNDVMYDPTGGFQLKYPNPFFSGEFYCKAILGDVKQTFALQLFYMTPPENTPQPQINDSLAKHPMVGRKLFLTCHIDIEPTTLVIMEWSHPVKDVARVNISQDIVKENKNANYAYRSVSKWLTVTNLQLTDAGIYRCTATDHSGKSNFHEIKVLVYGNEQPTHINLTTDINLSKPIESLAGADAQFLVNVNSYPALGVDDLYWEKDNSLIFANNRIRITKTATRVQLAITKLKRKDSGVYTLYGRTPDQLANLSITLLVKDKPSVNIGGDLAYYMTRRRYELHCTVNSYPPAKAWWRWKPCNISSECNAASIYGWTDIEPVGSYINRDNVTMLSSKSQEDRSLRLAVVANHSGLYRCMATNEIGQSEKIVPFIVTDASDGFEVIKSPSDPVEGDSVTLTCRASIFNYTDLQWRWQPVLKNTSYEIPSGDNSEISQTLETTMYSHVLVLNLKQVEQNTSGIYTCIAWYRDAPHLSTDKSLMMAVQDIQMPAFTNVTLNGSVELFTSFEFLCYVTGVPFPNITWYKDGSFFDVSTLSGVEFGEWHQRLVIRRVVQDDAGDYQCLASNKGGTISANGTLQVILNATMVAGVKDSNDIIMIVVFVATGIALVILTFFLVKKKCEERKYKQEMDFFSHTLFEKGQVEMFNPDMPLEDQVELLPYDHRWEFPKERLKLGKTVGQGAFGRVVKAEAIGLEDGETMTTVAVKMLKERADLDQRRALMAELKILIHLGRHLNIVNLLGAVTKQLTKGELMVIVEYCCYGNLRHYLLRHRDRYVHQIDPITDQVDPSICSVPMCTHRSDSERSPTTPGITNPMYSEQAVRYAELLHSQQTGHSPGEGYLKRGASVTARTEFSDLSGSDTAGNTQGTGSSVFSGHSCCVDKGIALGHHGVTTCDLLCYAFQCARGMEYLASRKLIHRDLAARNVLLAENNVVKICDFGLAKDCYKYSNYIKKGDGPLPIKWMAVESIRDKVFTIKSDVWSFGVLLWEFFTLGGNPYPGIEIDEEFYKKLKNGYRMEKPELAPSSIYHVMQDCWLADPKDRPDFSYLVDTLGNLLETGVRKFYVELNDPYVMMNEQLLNNNDYLKMEGQTDYLNMKQSPENLEAVLQDVFSPEAHYDNIGSVRPVGDGPPPKEPMEVVPMIQLDPVGDCWPDTIRVHREKQIPRLPSITDEAEIETCDNIQKSEEETRSDYLYMGGSGSSQASTVDLRTKVDSSLEFRL